jgi:hypothetical protein
MMDASAEPGSARRGLLCAANTDVSPEVGATHNACADSRRSGINRQEARRCDSSHSLLFEVRRRSGSRRRRHWRTVGHHLHAQKLPCAAGPSARIKVVFKCRTGSSGRCGSAAVDKEGMKIGRKPILPERDGFDSVPICILMPSSLPSSPRPCDDPRTDGTSTRLGSTRAHPTRSMRKPLPRSGAGIEAAAHKSRHVSSGAFSSVPFDKNVVRVIARVHKPGSIRRQHLRRASLPTLQRPRLWRL